MPDRSVANTSLPVEQVLVWVLSSLLQKQINVSSCNIEQEGPEGENIGRNLLSYRIRTMLSW